LIPRRSDRLDWRVAAGRLRKHPRNQNKCVRWSRIAAVHGDLLQPVAVQAKIREQAGSPKDWNNQYRFSKHVLENRWGERSRTEREGAPRGAQHEVITVNK
jgi:hypothetical protein